MMEAGNKRQTTDMEEALTDKNQVYMFLIQYVVIVLLHVCLIKQSRSYLSTEQTKEKLQRLVQKVFLGRYVDNTTYVARIRFSCNFIAFDSLMYSK